MAKFCHNCGKQLDDGAAFCAACGSKQISMESAPQPAAAAPAPSPAPKKKKKTGLIAALCAAVLVVALVLVGTLYVWPNFLSRDARFDRYMENAATALADRDYTAAQDAYEKAHSLGTGSAEPCIGLGDLFVLLESYDDAVEQYKAALKLDPERAEIYLKLAETYLADEDRDAALEILRDGLDATDGNRKIDARLSELSSPLSELEGILGEVADTILSGSGLSETLDQPAVSELLPAFANTAAACDAAMAQSTLGALGQMASALLSGQTSLTMSLADGEHSLGAQLDLCTDLTEGELSLSGSLRYDENYADATLYLGTDFGAFRSELLGSDWYGATWATLPDDLEASALYDGDFITYDTIAELRSVYAAAETLLSYAQGLDLSGLDWQKYVTALLSVEPVITAGTDEHDAAYTTFTYDAASTWQGVVRCAELLAEDEALQNLLVGLATAVDPSMTAEEYRENLAMSLTELADTLKDVSVGGTFSMTVYTANGYVTLIGFVFDMSVDGDVLPSLRLGLGFTYESGQLSALALDYATGDYYGLSFVYEIGTENGCLAETLTAQAYDGYGTDTIRLKTLWDRASGDLTISVTDAYGDTDSFDYVLRRLDNGAELTLDFAALGYSVDSGYLTIASYPGRSYVERPSRYVNLNEWDSDVLDRFSDALDQLGWLGINASDDSYYDASTID